MDNETLRKVQLAQLEIAKELKRVCDENGIKYFMDSGTLLGAVRHKGFIPWDDDMDFGMLRDEYEKFVAVAPKALKEEYFLQTWDTDEGYAFSFAKIRKKDTLFIETVSQKSTAHNGVYIDIFPYDVYPDGITERKKQKREVMRYNYTLLMKGKVYPWLRHKNAIKRFLGFCKYVPYILLSKITSREKIKEKYQKARTMYNGTQSSAVCEMGMMDYGTMVIPSSCFEGYISLPFEDCEFSAPIDSHLYLTHAYGDYMTLPPEDQRDNRHQILQLKL